MRLHWFKQLITAPLFLGLTTGPAFSNDTTLTNNTVAEAVTAAPTIPADPDPALWVVKDDDTTIYLFGTIHILRSEMTWFDEAIKESFDKSDELVIEMIEPEPTEMLKIVNELAIDETGISLRDKLSSEDRLDYETALKGLNLPPEAFDPLDPWFASVTISLIPLLNGGYDVSEGVEKELTARAEARMMTIIGLETARQQLGFFDSLPEETQIRFLNFTIDSLGDTAEGMNNMVAHWARGNVTSLGELMNANLEDEILYDTLLSNRNENWAVWVAERLKTPGTVFMAVGAGHLAGKGSLQEKLADKGLKTTQIEY